MFSDFKKNKNILNSIYLGLTPYKIDNGEVQQTDIPLTAPIKLYQAIKNFKSGQVYEVLHKKNDGIFQSVSNMKTFSNNENGEQVSNQNNTNKKFLIYIIAQDVVFNSELQRIAYIKDVSFGILYEQSKA